MGVECRLDLHLCRASSMRRMKGRAPGRTCAANESLPISDAACALVMTRWRRSERNSVVSSSTRCGVHDTVWLTESSWMPRKDRGDATAAAGCGLRSRDSICWSCACSAAAVASATALSASIRARRAATELAVAAGAAGAGLGWLCSTVCARAGCR